jgi:hypothetical protein
MYRRIAADGTASSFRIDVIVPVLGIRFVLQPFRLGTYTSLGASVTTAQDSAS